MEWSVAGEGKIAEGKIAEVCQSTQNAPCTNPEGDPHQGNVSRAIIWFWIVHKSRSINRIETQHVGRKWYSKIIHIVRYFNIYIVR